MMSRTAPSNTASAAGALRAAGGCAHPLGWFPAFQEALAKDRPALAMVLLAKGLQMGPPQWLPVSVLEAPIRLFLRGEARRELAQLLGTMPHEVELVKALSDHPAKVAAELAKFFARS